MTGEAGEEFVDQKMEKKLHPSIWSGQPMFKWGSKEIKQNRVGLWPLEGVNETSKPPSATASHPSCRMNQKTTMFFSVFMAKIPVTPSLVLSIMLCAARESRHFSQNMNMIVNYTLMTAKFHPLLLKQLRNQGFRWLFSRKTMHPPQDVLMNLWPSLSVTGR